jgi:ferredoxin
MFLRRLIALLFAVLLPLQTLAAAAMPIQGGQADAVAHHAMEGGHCDQGLDGANVPAGNACEQCGLCHMACAGMMPTAESTARSMPSGSIYVAETVLPLVSHTPEEPNPPPVPARS